MKKNSSYKILVVDDDPTLLLIAKKKLSQHGYQVLTAESGQEGVDCFLNHKPDLLLLDYQLPDMTGVEVCQYLNLKHITQPILFITGKNDYQTIEVAFEAGATDFAIKPLNWPVLIYRIQFILRSNDIRLSLLTSENRLSRAQKIAKIANWDFNPIDKSFKFSDTIYDILEMQPQQDKSFDFKGFLARIPEEESETVRNALDDCLNNSVSFEIEHGLITAKGNKKIISHLGSIKKNNVFGVFECMGTLQDITERYNAESRIRKLAYYDSLTGLMNRESFVSVLESVLSRNSHQLSAVLFIDLDDFKRVNDTLGHDFGDLLLCGVAERLTYCVRTVEKEKEYEVDTDTTYSIVDSVCRISPIDINRFDLGRFGGDEFTIFLADICSEEAVASIAKRVLKVLEKPFYLDGHEVKMSFSMGIAISPNDGDSIQALLKNADTAMYCAKTHGKNNFKFFTQAMNDWSLSRLTLEADLSNAIIANELRLVYQPLISLQSGRLVGAEALMRWEHKTQGNIPASEFIKLAEETGKILHLGDWLFKQFILDLQTWYQQGLIFDDFKLALNISSLQFDQATILTKVETLFPDLELNKHVTFELTESALMNNAETNLEKLKALAHQNISLSLDDFGTGYSSLSYLHRFPMHSLKIDRSLVSNMENEAQNIVKSIIAMAHSMEIIVIAEGIENQWQSDFLKQKNCDIGQGYFFYKPMSSDQFHQLLQS